MMTDNEIKTNWNHSKKDEGQVKILAELNAVSQEAMTEKLEQLGFQIFHPAPVRRRGRAAKAVVPIEFACPNLADGEQPLTLDQLVAILSDIAASHPGSTVSVGKKGEQISGVALLSQYTADEKFCVDVRLV